MVLRPSCIYCIYCIFPWRSNQVSLLNFDCVCRTNGQEETLHDTDNHSPPNDALCASYSPEAALLNCPRCESQKQPFVFRSPFVCYFLFHSFALPSCYHSFCLLHSLGAIQLRRIEIYRNQSWPNICANDIKLITMQCTEEHNKQTKQTCVCAMPHTKVAPLRQPNCHFCSLLLGSISSCFCLFAFLLLDSFLSVLCFLLQ